MVENTRAPLCAHRLRPVNIPQRVEVMLDAGGMPARIVNWRHGDHAARAGPHDEAASIMVVIDSWRVDDEWWRQLITRRYFDVVLEEGAHVVVFQDLVTQEWYVQQ